MSGKPVICVIDGAGYYFRAFFAIRQRLSNKKGLPTNAVYGFALMLKKIAREMDPQYMVIAMDSREKTFRHDMYGEYKAHRPQMPEELAEQLPYIDQLINAFRIPIVRLPGWEADDIIGTVAFQGAQKGFDTMIVSSDKDMLQLIGPGVKVYDPMKDKTLGEAEAQERFGAPPDKITDVLGLMGDSSDNIPGVPGVGEKTASLLIREYGDIEGVLAAAGRIDKKKLSENLIQFAEQARLSKRLATISTEAPVEFDPESWRFGEPDVSALRSLYAEMEFDSLLKELAPAPAKTVERRYKLVLTGDEYESLISALSAARLLAVDTETTSQSPTAATLVGISFAVGEGDAYYLPLRHSYAGAPAQIPVEKALARLKPLLEDTAKPKVGHNIKYDMIVLAGEGINVSPIGMDTMVADYLLDPTTGHSLSKVAMSRLGEKMVEYSEVCSSGARQITFDMVPVDVAANYSAEDADMTLRLYDLLRPQLEQGGFIKLMDEVETPLIETLVAMEMNGMLVDRELLGELSIQMGDDIRYLEETILKAAGEEFNINSPKQLGEILFGKLKLPGGRKTKTGFSTSQDQLEELSALHPLPQLVVEYRQLMKLKGTYVDALPRMINPRTGRIHTSFNQTVAATGRLSSSDPNLQNIPVRTELGRKIRQAFIAPPGHVVVSADYSQIELRLLAHFSGEPVYLEAFSRGEDIHAKTAAEIFNVSPAFVTSDMRRIAKTVNFGVIYGQTAFGLARELKIPRAEAQRYIDGYFKRHPAIRKYIETVIAEARRAGWVSTILSRRRPLPDITAKNQIARQMAERNAVNTPMQGSAADLIKIAMVSIHRRLARESWRAKMILQVHDELVFEAPEEEAGKLAAMVREEMEGAYKLNVPLVVEVKSGKNWDEAH
ncbi:MAG: DNA polymerase I [Nitrospinae bacterium]|nr:DNA polymerase I [Nitrospinota bacterium]